MGLLSLLSSNPAAFVIIAVALILSLTVHEFAHAFVADRLGDPTPRRAGRVTLNPLAHLDPFGALLLLVAGFGFAKPVPINPNNLGRWGSLWVSAAGPVSNILIAILAALLLKFLPHSNLSDTVLITVLGINIVLAIFNLLPIPLLDGSRILAAIFPRTLGRALMEFEMQPYSFILVMVIIYFGRNQIGGIINGVENWVLTVFGIV
ncbi:site-2 protease family protein [Deinococcus sp. KNUC1210]|uniref:site-2 protease family protein n=1 Tax=Deinococcus sp. KNUC1210 TaxID=2917691 RepID=UPI001EEF86B5|nr:site-2 protease family protein [Deinococcus sp. KNUC1210]ULH16157.1 site-2 protease family protein [Deinococcus sp. KNUC1210]